MKVYHMSDTLQLGMSLQRDYKKNMELTLPFVQALERSEDCFYAMFFNAKYLRAVLGKFGMKDMATNYTKWAVEGVFEYIRRTEFPESCCRLTIHYFFDNLASCRELLAIDWGETSEEEPDQNKHYEVDLDDAHPQKRDMRLFDEAFDAVGENENVAPAFDCARRYFSGVGSKNPAWEMLSDKNAVAVKDITDQLH